MILPTTQYVQKDIQSVPLENRAYTIIASKGVGIRIRNGNRLEFAAAHVERRGPGFYRAVRLRQSLQRMIPFACLRIRPAAQA